MILYNEIGYSNRKMYSLSKTHFFKLKLQCVCMYVCVCVCVYPCTCTIVHVKSKDNSQKKRRQLSGQIRSLHYHVGPRIKFTQVSQLSGLHLVLLQAELSLCFLLFFLRIIILPLLYQGLRGKLFQSASLCPPFKKKSIFKKQNKTKKQYGG